MKIQRYNRNSAAGQRMSLLIHLQQQWNTWHLDFSLAIFFYLFNIYFFWIIWPKQIRSAMSNEEFACGLSHGKNGSAHSWGSEQCSLIPFTSELNRIKRCMLYIRRNPQSFSLLLELINHRKVHKVDISICFYDNKLRSITCSKNK